MDENQALRRIRLRFGKLNRTLCVSEDVDYSDASKSKTLLPSEGSDPQVYDHPDRRTVFLYVPWFDDDKIAETQLACFTEWASTAQRKILEDYPNSVFEPSFLVRPL